MKQGANKVDQNRIAKLAAAGSTVEQISSALLIDAKIVKNFMPKELEKK